MPRDLDRDAVIYLTHRQWEGKRELDSLQLTTHGKLSYEHGEDVWRVSYKESDVTGLSDTLTSVSLYPDGRVRISREGQIRQELDFIKGEQLIEQRETPFGRMKFSIFTHEVDGTLNETGGDLRLGYVLSFNDRHTYSANVQFHITPRGFGLEENENRIKI
ncbi:MAG: DUF1934 domain-containing protein [Saccharofermentanales bacterium]|jgi:uncharacterized beta-barrel protein YwiB (DUF1934 family)